MWWMNLAIGRTLNNSLEILKLIFCCYTFQFDNTNDKCLLYQWLTLLALAYLVAFIDFQKIIL